MAGSDDLEGRVSALEAEVRTLGARLRRSEHDSAAARVLAGGVDRDVEEIRGEIRDFRESNTRVVNAMRADLVDLRSAMHSRFADVDDKFAELRGEMQAGFAEVHTGFTQIRGVLDATATGQAQIAEMLGRLLDRDDPA